MSVETLPIKSITYNHSVKRVVVDFIADQFLENHLVELSIGDKIRRTKSWKIAGEGQLVRIVAVFDDVVFRDLDAVCSLRTHLKGAQISYKYKPAAHILVDWSPAPDLLQDLTTLIAFPRSGSQFVQNIIKKNTSGIACSSIYSDMPLIKKRLNVRSHALNMGGVRTELRTIWDLDIARFKPIVLVRDPRDVFLSLYDYVLHKRQTKIEPKEFLDADYYWYVFEPEVAAAVRGGQTRALSMIDAYKIWYRNWVAAIAPMPGSLQVKYEDLVRDPLTEFRPIFDHLGKELPNDILALDQIVAKNGGSKRPRGAAQGWREAPVLYAPIIDAVSAALSAEIHDMNY